MAQDRRTHSEEIPLCFWTAPSENLSGCLFVCWTGRKHRNTETEENVQINILCSVLELTPVVIANVDFDILSACRNADIPLC